MILIRNDDDLNKAQDEDEEDENDEDDEEDTRKGYESIFPDNDSKRFIKMDSDNFEIRGRSSCNILIY